MCVVVVRVRVGALRPVQQHVCPSNNSARYHYILHVFDQNLCLKRSITLTGIKKMMGTNSMGVGDLEKFRCFFKI